MDDVLGRPPRRRRLGGLLMRSSHFWKSCEMLCACKRIASSA
jgi:hypothetical protein